MSAERYPVHQDCGGALVPAALIEDLDAPDPLYCLRCQRTAWGQRGDLTQATRAAAAEGLQLVPALRRPLAKTRPMEQLELLGAARRAR
jgi:hypothetical protein